MKKCHCCGADFLVEDSPSVFECRPCWTKKYEDEVREYYRILSQLPDWP